MEESHLMIYTALIRVANIVLPCGLLIFRLEARSEVNRIMSPFILAVNDGSSSLKITIYAVLPVPTNEDLDISLRLYRKSSDHQTHLEEIAHATVTDMTALPAKLKVWHRGKVIEEHVSFTYSTHAKAFKAIMDILFADSDEAPAELDRARIKYICHRIVHGGDLPSGQEISERTMSHLAQVEGLAPS